MILISGATGQNGRAVVAEFASRGVPVRALVRDANRAGGLRGLAGVEITEGDMLRPRTLGPAFDGVERALMISSADATMVEAQCTFVDAARAAGVRHVIKFSGLESGIGFNQQNFRYTRNHQQIERYLETSGIAWTHLRPGQFMQVYLRESRDIATRGVLALPAGQISLSPVDVLDIAQVAFHLLTTDGHEGRSYPMTGITPEERMTAMLAASVPAGFAEDLYDQAVERLKHPRSGVSLHTHAAFGVKPTTFAEFASRHAATFTASS
jgi:uncharacterized protein YbjT (DUF2867 family)